MRLSGVLSGVLFGEYFQNGNNHKTTTKQRQTFADIPQVAKLDRELKIFRAKKNKNLERGWLS